MTKIYFWRLFSLLIFLFMLLFFPGCELHHPQTQQEMRQLRREAEQRHLERTLQLQKMQGQIVALEEANKVTLVVFCVAFALFFVPVLVALLFLAKRYLELQYLLPAGANGKLTQQLRYPKKKPFGIEIKVVRKTTQRR